MTDIKPKLHALFAKYSVRESRAMTDERLAELIAKYEGIREKSLAKKTDRTPRASFKKEPELPELYVPSHIEQLFCIAKRPDSVLFPYEFDNDSYIAALEKAASSEKLERLKSIDSTYARLNMFKNLAEFKRKYTGRIKHGEKVANHDDEELSEFFTGKFINALGDDIINLCESCKAKIVKGGEESKHCVEVAKALMEYLKDCGFYTPEIKSVFTDNPPIFKNTEINSEEKMRENRIIQIKSFPYYLDYYDDNGDVKSGLLSGSCVLCDKRQ